ncbi:MAG: hypothetical protein ABL986_05240 [Vicinamibacterales bacterium]
MSAPARQRPIPGATAIVTVFIVIITIPGLGLALGFGRGAVSESEMRELARWPTWSWARRDLLAWPGAFTRYFDDHFAMRAPLIDARSALLWRLAGTSAFDTTIAGKNNWLFFADNGGLEDWTQQEPFSSAELSDWSETLMKRRAFLEKRGIRYLFVIAPDKQMIYPEYMPTSLRRLRTDYRADQLITHMALTAPDFPLLDLRGPLIAAKSRELLYHRYDTHWNDRGALVAYQAIARQLQRWFPSIVPLQREDFDVDPSVTSGDKTSMLGLRDEGKREMPGLVLRRRAGYRIVAPPRPDPYGEDPILIVEHRDRRLPRAIVFRDSFGARLIPYLSEHFSHVEYYWQDELDYDEIERQRPDVVIQEFVARHFFTYGPYPPGIPQ